VPTLTVTHEAPLELIRQYPQLAVDLVRAMSTTEWKDDFIESYVQIGVEQGTASARAQDVLTVLDVRRLNPTKGQRARVVASAGVEQLDRWFKRALTAASAGEVFAVGDKG
jgi:hypothetical protein